jgi:hypothetical protein
LKQIITKKLEDKEIVWFQEANRYLLVEQTAANIINDLYYKEDPKSIATKLNNKIDIPIDIALEFIQKIKNDIVIPNTIGHKVEETNLSYKIPEKFSFEKFYLINSKIFKVFFSNEFELSLIHPKIAHLEVKQHSIIDFTFQVFNYSKKTFLILDSKLIGSWSVEDIHYFQGKFSMKIIECIYEKEEKDWMGVFHASALNYNKNTLLILGDSGNGKSTSLALLQAQGFQCIADDFVPIDISKKIHTFPAGISIKKNSLPVLLNYYPELKNSAEYHYSRLNKTVRYLPPKNINYHEKNLCKALVFIKYDSNTDFEISKISSLEAFEKLVPDSWISPIPKNATTFLEWFEKLPCYQLTYSNNKKMYAAVKDIFEKEA